LFFLIRVPSCGGSTGEDAGAHIIRSSCDVRIEAGMDIYFTFDVPRSAKEIL
jgi:hypothetical protein